jgi:hypothetical protein
MYSKSIVTSKTFWINALMAAASILDMQYFGNMIPENIKALIVLGVNTVLRLISSNQPTTIAGGRG